jgi:plasmid stabilization system protein ParE
MRISWSLDAVRDLQAIYDYLDQHDPRTAVRALQAIREKALLLQEFPNLGPPLDGGTRRLSVTGGAYVIVYETQPDRLSVLRVFDARQDWLKQ